MTKFPNISKDKKILIVEDETLLALGMEYTLHEYGYCVCAISSTANDAVAQAKKLKPDLILMDIKLKGKETGIDAANQIWNECKIPIVFLTSYSDDQTVQQAVESEPYGYLIKPCRDEELKVTIETAFKKHQLFYKVNEASNELTKRIVCVDGFEYDKSKNLLCKDSQIVNLTGKEIRFFDILSDYPGEPISFERISDYVWDDGYADIAKLRTLVYRIKNKVGKNLIENVYEHGYLLNTDAKN